MKAPGLIAFGATDVGRQRTQNEDCFFCDPAAGVFVVIDGVGGYAAGEIAAGMACDLVSRSLANQAGTAAERLRAAITMANNEIYRRSRDFPAQHGMACVLTAAIVEDGQVTVGHVGDTRLYEVRREGIRKITRDHSPVGLREDDGELSELEAMNHPRRNEILRDLGSAPHARSDDDFIDIYQIPWTPECALLLCTDGLTDLVPKSALHQVMLDNARCPESGVQTLVELANEMGGTDNVTVVIVEGPSFAQPPMVAPAESFEQPGHPVDDGPAVARPPRLSRSRTAFFAYGWLVGGLLSVMPLLMVYQLLHHRLPDAAPEGQTLRVAPDGTGDYGTIREALEAARPADVVELAPGIYRENILLKGRVAVVGPASGTAVLQGSDAASGDTVIVGNAVSRVQLRSVEAPARLGRHAVRHDGAGYEAPGVLTHSEVRPVSRRYALNGKG